jgi:hypothetical protein
MKKRDLLFAGLLLMGLPVSAQLNLNDPNGAHVVFSQDFEGSWEEWKTTVIDSIKEIQYYLNTGTSNGAQKIWESPDDWKLGPVRTDSTIYIYNGEMTVQDSGERAKKQETWGDDPDDPAVLAKSATLKKHVAADVQDFADYGVDLKFNDQNELDDTYFEFTSDTLKYMKSGVNSYSGGLAARYRRNLFVRLEPGQIEEHSSYRLTFYVKAKVMEGHKFYSATPTVYGDVMRGYYHEDKPFSMGYIDYDKTNHPYEHANTFEGTKNDFAADKNWDNWEKFTVMTYYTTDSIAENFMYKDGYWWAADADDGSWEGSWKWKKGSRYGDEPGDTLTNDLRFIKQHDKFFVRLGFPGDYTVYSVDNISLTKSWIAGCEYNEGIMRVNFGYKTNLTDLVAKNKKEGDKLDQIEVPASNFQVYVKDEGVWKQMPMRSAEYHADGYMYLFTNFWTDSEGEEHVISFATYDSVLVCFQNPTDERLQLKYTSTPFPKGDDTTWVKNGSIVPDFVNELATPNPSAKVWSGVHSKYDLPPVCIASDFEDGEFGLAPVSQMKFAFSRKVLFDDDPKTTKALAYVDDEQWEISYDPAFDTDTVLIIRRPGGQPLAAGDHIVELSQLVGLGTEAGEDVILHLHFGDVARTGVSLDNLTTYWSSKFDDAANSANECLPEGTALFVTTGNAFSGYTEHWFMGDGSTRNSECRLYTFPGDYNRGFNLNSRGNSRTAKMFFGVEEGYEINLQKGTYALNLGIIGINAAKKYQVYIMPWDPEKDGWNEKPQRMTKVTEWFRTTLFDGEPSIVENEGIRTAGKPLTALDALSLNFTVAEQGRYVVEIDFTGGDWERNYSGILITNLTITSLPSVSFNPINALNTAVDAATTRINLANDSVEIYGCKELETLIAKRDFYNYDPEGGFKPYPTKPSAWYAAKDTVDKYAKAVADRMAKVDDLVGKIKTANDKIAGFDSVYMRFDVTAKLQALIDSATNKFAYTTETTDNMDALGKLLDDATTAVTNRQGKNDNLKNAIAEAEKQLGQPLGHGWAEYAILSDTLDEAKALDAAQCRDGEVDTVTTKLTKATYRFTGAISGYNAKTAPLKELRDIAQSLEADDVDIWSLNNFIDTTEAYNEEIADIYKTAIKLAIYQTVADDPDLLAGGADATPFINNYNFFATNYEPYYESSLKLATGNDYKNADLDASAHPGSTIMYLNHEYGNDATGKKCWVLMYDSAYANVFPGWTIESKRKGAHSIVSPDITCNSDHVFNFLRWGVSEFDGAVTLDWNSQAILKGGVNSDLPVGIYALTVVGKTGGDSDAKWKLSAVTTDSTYVQESSTKDKNKDLYNFMKCDSVLISDGKLAVELEMSTTSGTILVDEIRLIFLGPADGVNYGALATALEGELADKIANRKTFVNAPVAAGARVEYYTVGGMKVDAPKAGEVIIRKTTKNGKVVVDKILVK